MSESRHRGSAARLPRRSVGPPKAHCGGFRAAPLWLLLPLLGCLDPLVSDQVTRPDLILAAGSEPPLLADNRSARTALDGLDGVSGDLIPLRTGFAHGERILYWDFGPASPAPIPLYLLVEEAAAGPFETASGRFAPVPGHPPIFDAIPGDPGYSPWWTMVLVPVTERYQGEVLASFAAVDEAYRVGLVGLPMRLTTAINCPVVLPEARLETIPGDEESLLEPNRAYYKGTTVHYFSFATLSVEGLRVPVPEAYLLRREGGEPLSELERGVDMTRDGDLADTNDLFAAAPGDDDYSDMFALVDVVVTDGDYIDTHQNDSASDLTDAAQLFSEEAPDPDRVIALRPQGTIVNRPIQPPVEVSR
jgi:hypothetical protein